MSDDVVTPVPEDYLKRLRHAYKQLLHSRVVKNKHVDSEALAYFQRYCNQAIPTNAQESSWYNLFRKIYYAHRRNFQEIVVKVDPCTILMAEARAIVVHFGVENLIYINWNRENNSYEVVVNERMNMESAPPSAEPVKREERATDPIAKLNQRFDQLELALKGRTRGPRRPSAPIKIVKREEKSDVLPPKPSKETKDPKEPKEPKETKDPKEPKEPKEPKDNKELKEAANFKPREGAKLVWADEVEADGVDAEDDLDD